MDYFQQNSERKVFSTLTRNIREQIVSVLHKDITGSNETFFHDDCLVAAVTFAWTPLRLFIIKKRTCLKFIVIYLYLFTTNVLCVYCNIYLGSTVRLASWLCWNNDWVLEVSKHFMRWKFCFNPLKTWKKIPCTKIYSAYIFGLTFSRYT